MVSRFREKTKMGQTQECKEEFVLGRRFKIAIVLKIVQSSYNKNSGVDTTHQGPGAGVFSYALGAYVGLMEEMLVLTSERADLNEN